MNQNDFFEALRTLDSETVEQAGSYQASPKPRSGRGKYAAAALGLLLLIGGLWGINFIAAQEFPIPLTGWDNYVYDAYEIRDFYVDEHYAENATDLYIMGLKTDTEFCQNIVNWIQLMEVAADRAGIGSRFAWVDYSVPAVEFILEGTYTGTQTDENGNTVYYAYDAVCPIVYFPRIIGGKLDSILMVFCSRGGEPYSYKFVNYDRDLDVLGHRIQDERLKPIEPEGWNEYIRNRDFFFIWQALSPYTSPEEPLYYVTFSRVQGGGVYNVVGNTAYRTKGEEPVGGFPERTIEKLPKVDLNRYAEAGIDLEVHCWPLNRK